MITVDLRPGKQILGKQIRPNFLLSTSLLYKILTTNLGVCKPTYWYFLYITSEVKQNYLSYRPRTYSIAQFFKTNCIQSIFRRINRRLLAKTLKQFPKSPIRPVGSHFWRAPNLQWTLTELLFNIIKNLLSLFFYLMVF